MKSLILFSLHIFLADCFTETDLEVIMVADVISSLERPTAVVATLCWPIHKKLQLYSSLDVNIADVNITPIQFVDPAASKILLPEPAQHIVFVADVHCPNMSSYFQMNYEALTFHLPYRWIIINELNGQAEEESIVVPKALSNVEILPDSEVILIHLHANGSAYFVYKTGVGSEWRKEPYGSWDAGGFHKTELSEPATALRRINLEEYPIAVSYVLTDPDSVNHLTDGVNDHIDTITKVNFPTTNHLLDFLNASRKFVFANTWGYKVNGTWNGMTGYLVRDEVEIGGSPMFFTSERISIVEYIVSPTPTRSKFVFQQPKLSYENNLFLLSFRNAVWYSSIALVFILALAIFAVAFWEWKRNANIFQERNVDASILRPNFIDVSILIFGATCQQGSSVELKGSLGRVVLLVLLLTMMFLYTSYSANIVALLQSSSSQIKTLEDLLNSRIKFGVHDTVFNRYYFSTATERTRKAIYETKVAPKGATPRFMTMEDGIKKMQKGLFAFHMETGVGYKFVGKFFHEGEKCGLKEIQYLQVIDPWLAVRKNTPYMEMFKIGMKRIQEHGLQTRENHLLYEKRPKCSGRGGNFVSVSMVDCYPALLILSYGALFATFLLFMEMLVHRRQELMENCVKRHRETH